MLYDEELERAILHYIIFENYIFELNEDDFISARAKKVFKAIKKLQFKKKQIDMSSIRDEINAKNDIDVLEYLSTLYEHTWGIDADTVYEKLIELSSRRKLFDLLKNTMSNINDITTEELIKEINDIEKRENKEKDLLTQISDTVTEIENNYKHRNDYSLYTGLIGYDKKTCGLHNQELTIIGARPGVGKTTLALQIAEKIAKKQKNVVYISLEMSEVQMIQKIIAKKTNVNSYKMRMGTLEDPDWQEILVASNEISELPLKIVTNAITIQKIESIARRLKNRNELDLLIIDYIQLIKNKGKFGSREQEVADITRTLKLMSLELNIPIIGLCQLNRNASRKEPSLADLRESGAIEQDADNVIFLYQEEESEKPVVDVTLKIAKQRAGEVGKVQLKFDKPKSKFSGGVV